MHHALEIDEILQNIIAHCNTPPFKNYSRGRPDDVASDLLALATTCRTFKEPALDALWAELSDLSPLAMCLPEVSNLTSQGFKWYSFKRSLEQAEWDTLRSYTRRIRSVLDFGSTFRPECVRAFLNPPDSQPLFPNLRYLRCTFSDEVTPLLHQYLPSLTSLNYSFVFDGNMPFLREAHRSCPGASNLKELSIRVHQPEPIFDAFVSSYICRWSNPRIVHCPQITLDANALIHLSHVPDLTQLTFALGSSEIVLADMLVFPKLRSLKLLSGTLDPISSLLARVQLPAVKDFAVEISGYPSKGSLASFLSALQPSGMSESITSLRLTQMHRSFGDPKPEPLVLTADDLSPITALRRLRFLQLELRWSVGLTDSQLLGLAAAWPHLESLHINEESGWQTLGGITPGGLARLQQTCRALTRLAVAVDTRGCTDVAPTSSGLGLDSNLVSRPSFSINVLDSAIDEAAVPGVAAFFAQVASSSQLSFRAWSSWAFTFRMNKKVYAARWNEAYARASEAVVKV